MTVFRCGKECLSHKWLLLHTFPYGGLRHVCCFIKQFVDEEFLMFEIKIHFTAPTTPIIFRREYNRFLDVINSAFFMDSCEKSSSLK